MPSIFDLAYEWNNANTAFTALRVGVTNTASLPSSKLADFVVNNLSVASIGRGNGSPILSITKPSSATQADSCLNLHTLSAPGSGHFLRCFIDTYSTTIPVLYINDGGHFYSRLSHTISGHFVGQNIVPALSGYSGVGKAHMFGIFSDVDGGCMAIRNHGGTPNDYFVAFLGDLGDSNPPTWDLTIYPGGRMAWGTGLGIHTEDTVLRRNAAANLALGNVDAASPVAQTLSVQNVAAGNSNAPGADMTINLSRGTGNAAGGKFFIQGSPAGSSGTSQNALTPVFQVDANGIMSVGAHSALASEVATGFITIKDISGNTRKLAVVS